MPAIVLATADESLRLDVLARLAAAGHTATVAPSWAKTVALVAQPSTSLVLLDEALEQVDLSLLTSLCRSLPHAPTLRWVRGTGKGVEGAGSLRRLVDRLSNPLWSPYERRLLPLAGLGEEVIQLLHMCAHSPMPVRLEGERGSGKEWLARQIHRLSGDERPFVVLRAGDAPVIRGAHRGTLYLENLDRHDTDSIMTAMSLAEATGWKVLAGSREPPSPAREGMTWTTLRVKPLRERPRDLKPLARLYLEEYTRRLGLPKRRVTTQLWTLVERHPWPGNQRELESFIVQAATSARGPWLSPTHIPARVANLLRPQTNERAVTTAFEELVEERLRPLVQRYEAAPNAPSLHRVVIDPTERALIRLVLARTGGNQKAAAALLGLSRNTLRTRMERLDPLNEQDA